MEYRKYTYDCLVIGTGAAGYNAANRIKKFGKKSVAMLTENIGCGTSRNTGSDKQTYYKLGLGGDSLDSVSNMAKNLFSNGATDGDNALCEAALSSRCFLNLCELGVPFPTNRYGEYVGYKTDHDPYARATSAGPLTSKFMTEALEKEFNSLDIPLFDKRLCVEILKDADGVIGLIALNKAEQALEVFFSPNIILATGGPAGIYADSVFPLGHTGSSSLAVLAGAHLQNMTEWQYGMASTNPRWNVSGTYMQVLPRIVSIDENGTEYEFLTECYDDLYDALSAVFLKGYQWPFDSKKAVDGSSVVDLLVYRECVMRGRKVYLDFTKNPFGLEKIEFEKLSSEAYDYLKSAEACFGTPIERLLKMNTPAVELYSSKGVDITKEYLEIAVCAQHNNGGIAVNLWWETSVKGLFAVGECAGTHGIARPGGSALNAGQVGSLRAAQYISECGKSATSSDKYTEIAEKVLEKEYSFLENTKKNPDNAKEYIISGRRRMSNSGGAIRNPEEIKNAILEIQAELRDFESTFGAKSYEKLYKLKDMLIMQLMTLSAMLDFSKTTDGTRGSALYTNDKGVKNERLDDVFKFIMQDSSEFDMVQEVYLENDEVKGLWRKVRPIPEKDDFFENVWREYNKNKNIF